MKVAGAVLATRVFDRIAPQNQTLLRLGSPLQSTAVPTPTGTGLRGCWVPRATVGISVFVIDFDIYRIRMTTTFTKK